MRPHHYITTPRPAALGLGRLKTQLPLQLQQGLRK